MFGDAVWISNRLRYRKGAKGSRLRQDDQTGYLEPSTRRGFSAEAKKTFIARLKICSNMWSIAKSIPIDIQTVYDAVALDPKFRQDVLKCNEISTRSKHLNDEMVKLAASEKQQVITDLGLKLDKYQNG